MLPLLRAARYFLLPYLALALGLTGLLLATPPHTVFYWINGHYSAAGDWFFGLFTNVGDGLFYVLITGGLLWVRFRWALLSLACFVVSSAGAQGLKHFVFPEQTRPLVRLNWQSGYPAPHLIPGELMHGFYSFPSGHTTTAFSVFLLLSVLARDRRWGWLFLALAAAVAYSRVYLAQHFPEDVLAGSVLGTSLTLLVLAALGAWLRRHPRPWHEWRLRGFRLAAT